MMVKKLIFPTLIILSLALIIIIAVLLNVVKKNEEPNFSVNSKDYSQNPQKEVEISCTDDVLSPENINISRKSFITFIFTNKGLQKQRFGIRPISGNVLRSTIAIAPQTKARFSWRVPDEAFSIEMYCSDHPGRENDIIRVITIE